MLPLAHLICLFGCVFYPCYADDAQFYFYVKPGDLKFIPTAVWHVCLKLVTGCLKTLYDEITMKLDQVLPPD